MSPALFCCFLLTCSSLVLATVSVIAPFMFYSSIIRVTDLCFSSLETRYGVPRYSLFSVADLFEERDLQRVLDSLEALAIKATSNGVLPKYETAADKAVALPKLPSFSNDLSKADRRRTRLMNRGRPLPIPPSAPSPVENTNDPSPTPTPAANTTTTNISPSRPSPLAPNGSTTPRDRAVPVPALALPNAASNAPSNATRTVHAVSHAPRLESDPSGSSPRSVSGSSAPKIPLPASPREKAGTLDNCITRLSAAARSRIARRIQQKRVTDVAYRARVAQEILSTEMVYVQSLKMLKRVFLDPLMASATSNTKPLLTLDEVKAIFSSLEVICAYNDNLLEQLQPRVQDWSPQQRLGDIFLQICGFLKVYTNYVANYNISIYTLNRCRTKKEKFAQWLSEREALSDLQGLKLGALLILPVQRIPRYQLLLSSLSQHTWESHADYQDLRKATLAIQEVAIYLNDKKRLADNIAKVTEIQEQFIWDEDLAQPHRLFVKEFTFKALFPGKDKELKDRKFYFFNDLVIVTKPHRGTALSLLSKGSDKGKEKVVSSHHLECVHFTACTALPSGVPSSSSVDTYVDVKDLGSSTIINDKLATLYYIDAGSHAVREEILTIFHQYAAERRANKSASGTTSPAGSRPASLKPEREDSSDSSDKSKEKEKEKLQQQQQQQQAQKQDDSKKKPARPSRGKTELQNLHTRSTLHGDPRKHLGSIGSSTSSIPVNNSSLAQSSPSPQTPQLVSPLPEIPARSPATSKGSHDRQRSGSSDDLTSNNTYASDLSTMPVSSLSPRHRRDASGGDSSEGSVDLHHDPLAGALSPRVSPDSISSPDSAARRASFKRSVTERPAVPPKPDRLRSGQAPPPHNSVLGGLGSTSKPSAPPPSMPPPSAPNTSIAPNTSGTSSATSAPMPSTLPPAPPSLVQSTTSSAHLTSPSPSPKPAGTAGLAANASGNGTASAPSSAMGSPEMSHAAAAAAGAVHPSGASTPAPMKRADTTNNASLLRRQTAFKSKTMSSTTNDLLPGPQGSNAPPGAQQPSLPSNAPPTLNLPPRSSISSRHSSETPPSSPHTLAPPAPTNDPALASSSQPTSNGTSSHTRGPSGDDTNLSGSSAGSINRPTRQVPSPRASVVNHNHVPPSTTPGK